MRHLPVEPPAFFHRGPSPLARLAFFGLVSLSLLFLDTRYRYLENIRQAVAVALYPLQRAAQVPGEAIAYVGSYFVAQRALVEENAELKRRLVEQGAAAQGFESARADNARLKAVLDVRARYGDRRPSSRSSTPAAIPSRRSCSSTRARTPGSPRARRSSTRRAWSGR